MAAKKKKPAPRRAKRAPPAGPVTPPTHGIVEVVPLDLATVAIKARLDRVEKRLDAFEARLDKMADALAPALAAWRNIRARIPGWILSLDPPASRSSTKADRELPAGDSEEE